MWNYSKKEHQVIAHAWARLAEAAETRMGAGWELALYVKMERGSGGPKISSLSARFLIARSVFEGMREPDAPISSIGGFRHSIILARVFGADNRDRGTLNPRWTEFLAAMPAAIEAHDACTKREHDANMAELRAMKTA